MKLSPIHRSETANPLALTLFEQVRQRTIVQTDHMFAVVMVLQWLAGIAAAMLITPYTWTGNASSVHVHVYAAIFLGGLINLIPATLGLFYAGRPITRNVIAVAQMLAGSLLIDLTGGRIETHFHVFCSLAMLAFYRDWTLLASATLVTLADHVFRGAFAPLTIYGTLNSGRWRWLEHAQWVVYEDLFLGIGCVRSVQEMWRAASGTAEAQRSAAVVAAVKESSLDCILTLDEQGRVLDWNPSALACFGESHLTEAQTHGISRVLGPSYDGRVCAGIRSYLKEGSNEIVGRRIEITGRKGADDLEFPMEATVVAVRAISNIPTTFVAYLRDITDRRAAKTQALLAEKLAMVASRTDNAVIITDRAGHIEWVNAGFSRISGYEASEVIGKRPGTFLQGADTDPATAASIRERIKAGVGGRSEIVNYGKTGRRYWLSLDIQPIRDSSGNVTNFIAIESDVTERKHAEEAMQRSESLLRSLIHSIPDLICYTSTEGKYLGCNRAFEKFAGRTAGYLLGRTDEELFREDPTTGDPRPQMAPTAGGHREQWATFHDGKRVLLDTYSTPFHDANGDIAGFIGISRDITQRRQAERLMLEAKETADAAREAALAASHAKSEFLANMSHEIRTPLNGVIGMIELLDTTHLTAQQRQYAGLMRSSADALLSLINDILDFSKIEAGKLEIESIEFQLQETIETAVQMLAPRAAKKKIELCARVEPAVGRVFKGDPDRLRQLIFNLVNNAVKFTDSGAVTVTVTAEPEMENQPTPEGTQYLRVSVTDTGIGIPPERLNRLFKSFSQVDASTTRRYGGTGLGLAICKQLSELMGGHIGVNSVAGKGSTFWFTIRLQTVETQDAVPVLPVDLRGMQVLLVDPVEAHARAIADMLHAWNLSATIVADGASAEATLLQAAAANRPFRMMICESILPDITAASLISRIKLQPSLSACRTIALHPVNQPLTAEETVQLGFAASVVKPVRQSVLFDTLICTAHDSVRADPAPLALPPVVKPASAPVVVSSHRLLVADDNEINQMVVSELLKRGGYECDVVSDGRAALTAVQSRAYAVVLMDCQMPDMDGFEATRILRTQEALTGRHLPVIALTANAVKGDREQCIAAGMDDYLSKPLKPAELFAKLKLWVGDPKVKAA